MRKTLTTLVPILLAVPAWFAVTGADHAEAPATRADASVDIADVYTWHDTATGRLVIAVTFAGLQMPGVDQSGTYNPDALYTIHIDQDGDAVSDVDILCRFGLADDDSVGIQALNVPGVTGAMVGPVETVITNNGNGAKLFAGLRDDPFFFDLDGFNATVDTGTLAFDASRDTFAGTNITAIVLAIPLAAVTNNGSAPILDIWATTSRLGMVAPTAVSQR